MSNQRGSLSMESVGRSALILTGGQAAVQVIGIVRELFLAARVGVSSDLDALLVALVLPTTLSAALTSGATTALVPTYLEARASDPAEARRLAGAILGWVGLAGLGLWVGLQLLAPVAVEVAGPGLTAAGRASAIAYLPLLAPIVFLAAIGAVLAAVCQAEQRFAAISIANLAGSAATLITMLGLWGALGLEAFAVGSLVGPAVSVAILSATMVHDSIAPLPIPRWDARLKPLLRHAAPLTVSSAILQINTIGDRAIASLLGPGAVSALRYADVLVRTPIGAIGPAWGSAIYPVLVHSALGDVADSLATAAQRMLRYAIVLFVPLAMLTAAVAPVAVAFAYGRGAFTPDDVILTARTVGGFSPLLIVLMASPVLVGALNARRSGRVLLIGGVINVILNITLDVVLGLGLGVAGIALSSSITQSIVLTFFAQRLARSESAFRPRALIETLGLAILAAAPASVAIGALAWTGHLPHETLPAFVTLVVVSLVGLASYLVAATRLGIDEPQSLVQATVRRLTRRGRLGQQP
jgi:putative peptidoglycan lipid II flippase